MFFILKHCLRDMTIVGLIVLQCGQVPIPEFSNSRAHRVRGQILIMKLPYYRLVINQMDGFVLPDVSDEERNPDVVRTINYCDCFSHPSKTSKRANIGLNTNSIQKTLQCFVCLFIGPRYTWGPIYGSECLKFTEGGL